MTHCMIDLETHDTKPTARILSIGAVIFDPEALPGTFGDEFYEVCDIRSQPERTWSQETLDWWAKRGPEARAALQRKEARPLDLCLSDLRVWWETRHIVYPWSHGASFDIPILEHAFRYEAPWRFKNIRDTRTIYHYGAVKPRGKTSHDALDDAKRQAVAVQEGIISLFPAHAEMRF